MAFDLRSLHERIAPAIADLHGQPYLLVIYATGAGAGLQQLLWEQPEASRTLLDAQFPYSRDALIDLIGDEPQQYCSQDTAIRMAVAAHARCRELAIRSGKKDAPTIGLGLTAAVATTPPKRGEHRLHIAVRFGSPHDRLMSGDSIRVVEGTFEKGRLTREEEGAVCDLLALATILNAIGVPNAHLPLPEHPLGFASARVPHVYELDATAFPFVSTAVPALGATINLTTLFHLPVIWPYGTQGTVGSLNPAHHLLFPGSFNPLHFGHEQMVRHAERMTGKRVVYMMNARHPDKGEIAPDELLRRAEQFRWRAPVLFTQDEPLFIDKARRFPGFGFLIGADVVLGLLNPAYYGDIDARDAVLRDFHALGTRFYVVGREVDGTFRTLDDIVIPVSARDLFVPVSGRWDVASRNLRQR